MVVEGGLVGAGRPGGLCGGVPRGRAVALKERGVVLREQRSRGLDSLLLIAKDRSTTREMGVVFRKRESGRAEESRPGLDRCRSQKTDQQHGGKQMSLLIAEL